MVIGQKSHELLVSAGHLCDLQGLFSETDNLRRLNRIELQLACLQEVT